MKIRPISMLYSINRGIAGKIKRFTLIAAFLRTSSSTKFILEWKKKLNIIHPTFIIHPSN